MYASTRVQWVCCCFLELVTNDCFYLCLLPATIPMCIVAEAQPRAGDILQPPPAAWPSRYKSGSRHSTVSQEPDQHPRETVLLTLQRGWGVAPKWRWQKTQGTHAPSGRDLFPRATLHLPTHRTSSVSACWSFSYRRVWRKEERGRTNRSLYMVTVFSFCTPSDRICVPLNAFL